MRSLAYRPRKEDSKKEEIKEPLPATQSNEVVPEEADNFDESVVIN
jgi:hypothetical protein